MGLRESLQITKTLLSNIFYQQFAQSCSAPASSMISCNHITNFETFQVFYETFQQALRSFSVNLKWCTHEVDEMRTVPTGKKILVKMEICLPVCLYTPHKAKRIRHYLRDFKSCPEQETNAALKTLADEKAATGPSKSRRAQTDKALRSVK